MAASHESKLFQAQSSFGFLLCFLCYIAADVIFVLSLLATAAT